MPTNYELDYYKALNITKNVSKQDIKKAYHTLSTQISPR